MKEFKSERRLNKITSVLKARQHSLKLVLENVHDPHNVSAVFRTCDAAGIPAVSLIYNKEKFPRIGKKSSASAYKWVEKEKFDSVDSCFNSLRENGYKIFASTISADSKDLFSLDFTQKSAIVLGNEHRGVSDKAAELADERFMIPMFGMVQSLNISVAAAIILYEALRQRYSKGLYNKSEFNSAKLEELIELWCNK